ncbi:hypothetical protein [Clostridium algidicarnis]|uniref:hypothetical protein n=1 Tax=Clostridium algidicarnis TaxID=37659 RepID=UPI001C0BC99D|nr:hypothetical protein [Clostridium algidicarnis]MBU3194071.1 hypothetical protein [Clostridium algidicarnis]
MPGIFSEFKIKDLKLKNRIVMAPMCMDSSRFLSEVTQAAKTLGDDVEWPKQYERSKNIRKFGF